MTHCVVCKKPIWFWEARTIDSTELIQLLKKSNNPNIKVSEVTPPFPAHLYCAGTVMCFSAPFWRGWFSG